MRTLGRLSTWQSLALAIAALTAGCKFASPEMKHTGAGGAGGVGGGGVGGGGGAGGRVPPNIGGFPGKDAGSDAAVFPPLTDFPADPIIDSTAPANAPALFDGSTPRADGRALHHLADRGDADAAQLAAAGLRAGARRR